MLPRNDQPKRLVVFLDGTWQKADDGPTSSNVVRLMRRIAPVGADGMPQVVYYRKGVGTGGMWDKLVGGATGNGLGANLRDAYYFLGNNWRPGDEVHIFGFSRGAFTARSLAGFIGFAGLLDRDRLGRLGEAWRLYRTWAEAGSPADRLRHARVAQLGGTPAKVACLGVWDTVGALGVPLGWLNHLKRRRFQFHDTRLGPHIQVGLHALALDERRFSFEPTLWHKPKGVPVPQGRVVEQCWFAGAHTDVGGGYAEKDLADIPLRWMCERVAALTGLTLADGWQAGLANDPLAPMHESRTLPYLVSRLVPFQRVAHGHDAWVRRWPRSGWNRAPAGMESVGESMHPSVRARFGRTVAVLHGRRARRVAYRPRAVAHLMGPGQGGDTSGDTGGDAAVTQAPHPSGPRPPTAAPAAPARVAAARPRTPGPRR